MNLKVLFFGMVKDIAGKAEDSVDLPQGSVLGNVFDYYSQRFPELSGFRASIVLALNQEFAPLSSPLKEGDEIAFLPPVSGGSSPLGEEPSMKQPWSQQITIEPSGHFFAITREPIHTLELTRRVLQDQDGAICTFEGVTRNNTKGRPTLRLEYECYEPMAIKLMAQIGQEIAAAHAISRIIMVHRLGTLEIGEASVVILTAAPHRGPSFEATRAGIDRLKKMVPIWKKEFFADGEVWVDGEWDDSVLSNR